MGSGQHNPLEVGAPVGGLDRLGKWGGRKGGRGDNQSQNFSYSALLEAQRAVVF